MIDADASYQLQKQSNCTTMTYAIPVARKLCLPDSSAEFARLLVKKSSIRKANATINIESEATRLLFQRASCIDYHTFFVLETSSTNYISCLNYLELRRESVREACFLRLVLNLVDFYTNCGKYDSC